MRALKVLFLVATTTTLLHQVALSVDFCVSSNTTSIVTSIEETCPPPTVPYRHAGVNLFDIFWDGWSPSASGTGNLSTSLKAVQDAGSEGIVVARVFSVPWSYTNWNWMNVSTREAYWTVVDTLLAEAAKVGLSIIPSLGYGCPDSGLGCNPSLLCPGEVYRDLIVNASSCTRTTLFAYATEFVTRYQSSPTILFWELGNEMNLEWDGCSYDKSDGAFFTQNEGLAFLQTYAALVKSADTAYHRPVNTGLASPRLRALHLSQTTGGGRACVSDINPKGDCDLYCPAIEFDSLNDTVAVLNTYYLGNNSSSSGSSGSSGSSNDGAESENTAAVSSSSSNFEMVSIHWYSCAPPNGNYSWCVASYNENNATTYPLNVFKQAADDMGLPLYVGEYGPDTSVNVNGWGPEPWRGVDTIIAMQSLAIQLSTLWAFECPSHHDMNGLCLHPGDVDSNQDTFDTLEVLMSVERALQGKPPSNLNLSLYMLEPPRPGSSTDPACLDGTAYGYYARLGDPTKWVVMLQGGGWCESLYACFQRTLDGYAGSELGSSRHWSSWSWGWWFGPRFVDYSYLYLPYADGASYSGLATDPIPTPYIANATTNITTTLYFRGASNMNAAVADALQRFNIPAGSVEEIIVTGGSAGGLSTTLHLDRLQTLFGNPPLALGMPQCGFFAMYNETCQGPEPSSWCNATDQFRYLYTMHNASGTMNPQCLQDNAEGDNGWKCFMAPIATAYVKNPLLIWQAKFDHFQLNAFVDLQCMLQQQYNPPWNYNVTCDEHDTNATQAYGELFMAQIQQYIDTPGPFRSIFLTSCVLHGMDYNYLSVEDTSVEVAFNLFYDAYKNSPSIGIPTLANDYKWIESLPLPRVDNNLACPPFNFTQSEGGRRWGG